MISWELARRKKGVWKGEKVENEEAARDSLGQSDKQIICLVGSGWEGAESPDPMQQPRAGLVQPTRRLWVRETDKTLISVSNKYRKGGCVHFIRNNREKLLTIIPNGLPVFWQWAQQLVCQSLTKCKNNNHPLSEPLICPTTFHLRLLRPPALSLVFWHLPHPLSTEALIHLLQGHSGKSHGKCWPFTLSYPGTLKP